MFLIYLVDYTTIARFSKLIAIGFLGFILAGITFGASIMMLYVPIYGAVVYKYHGTGYRGLGKSILWMILPVFLALRLPSVMLDGVLLISMMVQLTIAIANNWFCVSGKKVIAGLWGCAVGLPVFGLAGMYGFHLLASYQEARIRAFLTSSGDAGYLTSVLRSLLKSSRLVGNSGQEIIGVLPDFNSDWSYVKKKYKLKMTFLLTLQVVNLQVLLPYIVAFSDMLAHIVLAINSHNDCDF